VDCRRAVYEAEAVGGALVSALPPAAMRPHALAFALARIERPVGRSAPASDQPSDWITVPGPVVDAAKHRRRWAAPGVWVAQIAGSHRSMRAYLLGVGAGISVPRHSHRGYEMVCVLKGAYVDGETLHGPGDFACNDESVDHRPTITADGDCVCLVCAQGALVPRDWVGRVFQPFVGI
jgi:putative transcriptional regulator